MTEELVEVQELGPVKLGTVVERMLTAGLGLAPVMAEMERRERSVFEAYAGKYHATGALEASLTEAAASGAIRELRPLDAAFGSSIFYSVYQGTQGPGDHQAPSAILRAEPVDAVVATRAVAEYVLHGERE